ncbi:hypothetical protein M434DRAFT_166065 [Hypoxylon sp. CO27-5]|nr:hypothetical protein M434DRAFT_166065 [Hypoxylon sp. CO27-5]
MHPPLRSHGCMIQALGYGWVDDPQEGGQPYLIMDYSHHGTLVEYLQRCRTTIDERRELALDVASALKALHESRIVHGDVKPENVLVFDNDDNEGREINRPQVARLSDFSGVIFEQDFTQKSHVTYLGTERYLPPEMLGLTDGSRNELPSFDLFKNADIYSLGLLFWEILKNGQSYIDPRLKEEGETDLDFRRRISNREPDALYVLAKEFLDSSGEYVESKHSIAFIKAISMCLGDSPNCRGSMGDISQALAQGIREKPPRLSSAPRRINPRGTSVVPMAVQNQAVERSPHPNSFYTLMSITSENLQVVRPSAGNNLLAVVVNTPVPNIDASSTKPFEYGSLDIFKMAITEPLPRNTQKDMAEQIEKGILSAKGAELASFHLQLAVMYHIGYGVEPNDKLALDHLFLAKDQDPIAKSLFLPVSRALAIQNETSSQSSYQNNQDIQTQPATTPYLPRKLDVIDMMQTTLEPNGLNSRKERMLFQSSNKKVYGLN